MERQLSYAPIGKTMLVGISNWGGSVFYHRSALNLEWEPKTSFSRSNCAAAGTKHGSDQQRLPPAAKVEDVVGLYLNPPDKAPVLCVDEKSQIQALDRTQPGLPMKKGRAGTMTHDYK